MRRPALLPLYGAGFVTAFGAHSVAAGLGGYTQGGHGSLLALGIVLAVYDGAEILLKPVFGALADRIGPRRVLLGGLTGFALASGAFVFAGDPALVGVVRLGQGAAAAAFSPAAGALVARLTPETGRGRAFGGYGAWKGLGYTLGPVVGGVLITVSGYPALFLTLAGLAVVVAVWAWLAVPVVEPLPRKRQTVVDLVRRLTGGEFVRPVLALAGTTGVLAVAVGFLPVLGSHRGLGPLLTGVSVSVLAATAALVQPPAGRANDAGRLRWGLSGGLLLTSGGLAALAIPGVAGIFVAALAIGTGVGVATPAGFARLVAAAPPERVGQTLGAAEVGREIGDAGGPLLVGAVAAAGGLGAGFAVLGVVLAAAAFAVGPGVPRSDHGPRAGKGGD
ncbi:MFS transporter [Amycolatopsis acidicola]|uniref:MFS transporter n=1 Tax=Amycolatopsis acidicola TaxID=2596893 RepID=A0A5N0UM33_9PSEU|nr:MFS transporter [Amycolatopsis acidicola]KAA9150837.1 MFS transporter [Amycolatopsis acidicola]